MYLKLVPENTNYRFMWLRKFSFPLSMAIAVASIALFFTVGLNYGIDFKGGTVIEMKTNESPADIAAIRAGLGELNLGDIQVQQFGGPDEVLVRIQQQEGGELAQQAAVENVRSAFADSVEFRRVEVVGPRVSGELAQAGTLAVVTALVVILFYIWFRFEWQFAVGAIVTTINDIIVTVGLFVVLQLDFSLSSIAAILTIIGYSLNDTVVVYDRIRENLRRYKKLALPELIDRSINEMLSRTLMTSVTTLLALIALYTFGGEVIRSFTLAMIFGIVIGTYSSIFLAAPMLIFLNLRPGGPEKAKEEDDGAKATA
ncbi:protein translocase subunit SecF [Stappia sp. F7233]|uniref:Protein-export membrane protein SecF n=1 Tax=Stappia albiluteola TaxID=2758565 RepID=A0A839ADM9_9HYPH|nr:protein translocase subunit SecF [Stappia albiluteola]MBA5776739.1 protein translocase subunit SecF [Stappia albiluteola]